MDKLTVETTFFRSKPVHFQKEVTANPFFRSISVQLNDDIGIFPLHIRSLHASTDSDGKVVFRTISVHFYVFFSYLCTGKSVNTSTYMEVNNRFCYQKLRGVAKLSHLSFASFSRFFFVVLKIILTFAATNKYREILWVLFIHSFLDVWLASVLAS